MGLLFSSKKDFLLKGEQIREQLYERILKFQQKHQDQFKKIDDKLKSQVIMLSAVQLVKMLQMKEVTSYELVLIFAQRTSKIGVQNNYVFDEMFQEALQMARQCDIDRSSNPGKINWKGQPLNRGKCFPPFYGIPASYKQCIRMKGKTSHIGFVIPHEKNYCPQQNGLFAQLTIKMGFIPFVRTNVPMSCKTIETNNNQFGYSKNPWNQQRSCGGSSGGQGGLIGAYCSPIGFGTDIGGSVRIPAQWNGLATLKPAARYSRMGNSYSGKITGGTPIKSDLAPIARSVKDIILFMQFMCDQASYKDIPKAIADPYLNLKPFSDQLFIKKPKLKLGYICDLQTVSCSPSHRRVVNQALDILRRDGHQIKLIKMPSFQQLYFGMVQMYVADGSTRILKQVGSGQPLTQQFKLLELSTKIPNYLKSFLSWAIKGKQPRLSRMLDNTKQLKVSETFSRIYDIQVQIGNQMYKYFIDNQIDAVIMPGFAFPSPKLGTVNKLQYCFSYTTGWNVINYPVGTVPMGVVQQNQQNYEDQYNDSITRQIRQNMKQSKGMPVGIQIACLPFKEQVVTYLMSIVQDNVKFRTKYPCKNILRQIIQ